MDNIDDGNASSSSSPSINVDPHSRDDFLRTTLHHATNIDECLLLISLNADINAKDRFISSPLYLQTWNNRPNCVFILIHCGADINSQTSYGSTPLMMGVLHSYHSTSLLLDAHCDVDVCDKYGNTPLRQAITSDNWKGDTKHIIDNTNIINTINMLINAKSDINAQCKKGFNILHYAVLYNKIDSINILLDYNADTTCLNDNGDTPLQLALNKRPKIYDIMMSYRNKNNDNNNNE